MISSDGATLRSLARLDCCARRDGIRRMYDHVLPNGDVFPCHSLTTPEFRLGNLREQALAQLCRADGLLGRLAGLDFRELAERDPALAPLTRPGACVGEVYADVGPRPALRALPLV